MSKLFLLVLLLPIAYGLSIVAQKLCDKLLQGKTAELAEWGYTYEAPICSKTILFAMLYVVLGMACWFAQSIKGEILSCVLLVQLVIISIIDFKYQFIFDEQNLLLALTGLARLMDYPTVWKEPLFAGLGAFVIMFILMLISRGAIGGGDVKLMGALGIWLGIFGIINTFVYGIIAGGVGAIALLLMRKKSHKDAFAFGPYLCLGAIYAWYLQCVKW